MTPERRPSDTMPIDRAGALAIGRGARHLFIKAGPTVEHLDAGAGTLSEAVLVQHLVHEDGLLRVPVLVIGDVVVRGFTEALYRQALSAVPDPQ